MKNITYISASAGSGKTYTLTKRLAKMISQGQVRAGEVILTTFTNQAAAELKEKAQGELYAQNLHEAAAQLDEAMIGTVHGVANAFINKYWFYLGLSPQMGVLAEEDLTFYRNQSLAGLPTPEEMDFLHQFRTEFNLHPGYKESPEDFWKKPLNKILENAVSYQIDDLDPSRQKSLELIKTIYPASVHLPSDTPLYVSALEKTKQLIGQDDPDSSTNQERLQDISRLLTQENQTTIGWLFDVSSFLAKLPKKYKKEISIKSAEEDLALLWHSREIYPWQEKFVNLLFTLAKRWKEQFAAYKRDKQLLDYNDMEKYMLELLYLPEVAKEIQASYKYLFVDEFQDCSPIQVKIFDRLSELMQGSIWVGDTKQAIYGFRGSDTELTQAISDIIASNANNCQTDTLDTSYRALADLVETVNHVFTHVFTPQIPTRQIQLQVGRNPQKEGKGTLGFWTLPFDGRTDKVYLKALAGQIAQLAQTTDAKDIAVLARKNNTLDTLAEFLTQTYGLPVSRAGGKLAEYKETELLIAILSLLVDPKNNLAKAKIAFLTEPGYSVGAILDDKLQWDSDLSAEKQAWLTHLPIIQTIVEKRPVWQQQSVGGLISTVITELDLPNIVRRWGRGSQRLANLQLLADLAVQYEDHCLQLTLASTPTGFIDYLTLLEPPVAEDGQGIQLQTYHTSKGLQWDTVVLCSLDDDPTNEDKLILQEIYGVHSASVQQPGADNLYPKRFITFLPWLFGAKKKVPETIKPTLLEMPQLNAARQRTLAESARLLYVGMTRAKNKMLFALAGKEPLKWFTRLGIETNVPTDAPAGDLLGTGIEFNQLPTLTPEESETFIRPEEEPVVLKWPEGRTAFALRDQQPSKQTANGKATLLKQFGKRIPLGVKIQDMQPIGTCIHQIFCTSADETMAKDIVRQHGLETQLPNAPAITAAGKRFMEYLAQTFGPAEKICHEMGFKYTENGQIFTGSMDLVYQTPQGCVLVDYKTYPGPDNTVLDPQNKHYAGRYAGQFNCYTRALEQAGHTVLARLVYYPVSGLVVEIK